MTYVVQDYLPADDKLGDVQRRVRFTEAWDRGQLATATVSSTSTVLGRTRASVTAAQVVLSDAAVADLTVTITVNGRTVGTVTVPSGATSSALARFAERHMYSKSHRITLTVTDAGAQPGTARVALRTQPFELVPLPERAPESARERFKPESTPLPRRALRVPLARSQGPQEAVRPPERERRPLVNDARAPQVAAIREYAGGGAGVRTPERRRQGGYRPR